MKITDLIKKVDFKKIPSATPATFATHKTNLATVATVATAMGLKIRSTIETKKLVLWRS